MSKKLRKATHRVKYAKQIPPVREPKFAAASIRQHCTHTSAQPTSAVGSSARPWNHLSSSLEEGGRARRASRDRWSAKTACANRSRVCGKRKIPSGIAGGFHRSRKEWSSLSSPRRAAIPLARRGSRIKTPEACEIGIEGQNSRRAANSRKIYQRAPRGKDWKVVLCVSLLTYWKLSQIRRCLPATRPNQAPRAVQKTTTRGRGPVTHSKSKV